MLHNIASIMCFFPVSEIRFFFFFFSFLFLQTLMSESVKLYNSGSPAVDINQEHFPFGKYLCFRYCVGLAMKQSNNSYNWYIPIAGNI